METLGLTKVSKAMLSVLLSDPAILSKILMEGDLPKSCKINEDGSITFARSEWFWWSRICKSTKTVSFNDLAVKITEILAGVGVNKHPILEKGLKSEYFDTLFGGDKNKLISCWLTSYLVAFDGMNGTYLNEKKPSGINLDERAVGIPITMIGRDGKPSTVVLTFEQISAINSSF